MRPKQEAYAVVRYDEYGRGSQDVRNLIHIVAVVPTLDEAKSEVERLSQVNEGKEIDYFWVYAPYVPDGRGVARA